MNPSKPSAFGSGNRFPGANPMANSNQQGGAATNASINASPSTENAPKPGTASNGNVNETTTSTTGRSSPFSFGTGAPHNKAAIPAWQMAKSSPSVPTAQSSQTDASGGGAS